jgi:putative membrane protein
MPIHPLRFSDLDANTRHLSPLIPVSQLPSVNAALNSLSAIFLVAGYLFIKSRNIKAHKACMLVAFASSILFLISYLVYHYQVGSVPFKGQGGIRFVYFTILLTHTILATTVVPLALVTLFRAFKERFDLHRRIARWTFPIWLYVSVTGVVVYWMLYRI